MFIYTCVSVYAFMFVRKTENYFEFGWSSGSYFGDEKFMCVEEWNYLGSYVWFLYLGILKLLHNPDRGFFFAYNPFSILA